MRRWLLMLGLCGCSFSLGGPAPNRPRGTAPKCDTGKGMVIVDGVGATAFGIGTLAAIGSDSSGLALLSALAGALFVGAALHGNAMVDDCRREIGLYAAEQPPVLAPDVATVPTPAHLPPIAVGTVGTVAPAPTQEPPPQKIESPAQPEPPKLPPVRTAVEPVAPWREFWRELP